MINGVFFFFFFLYFLASLPSIAWMGMLKVEWEPLDALRGSGKNLAASRGLGGLLTENKIFNKLFEYLASSIVSTRDSTCVMPISEGNRKNNHEKKTSTH